MNSTLAQGMLWSVLVFTNACKTTSERPRYTPKVNPQKALLENKNGAGCSGRQVPEGIEITCGDQVPMMVPFARDGKDGKDGAVGATGARGAQGEKGLDGQDGVAGENCKAKRNYNSTTVTCGKDVFEIKDGERGQVGETGRQGPAGSTGERGVEGQSNVSSFVNNPRLNERLTTGDVEYSCTADYRSNDARFWETYLVFHLLRDGKAIVSTPLQYSSHYRPRNEEAGILIGKFKNAEQSPRRLRLQERHHRLRSRLRTEALLHRCRLRGVAHPVPRMPRFGRQAGRHAEEDVPRLRRQGHRRLLLDHGEDRETSRNQLAHAPERPVPQGDDQCFRLSHA